MIDIEGYQVLKVDEQFVVAIFEEDICFTDAVDFLVQRRQRHFDILEKDSPFHSKLFALQTLVEGDLVSSEIQSLPYVMSIHWANRNNFVLSDTEMRCLVDPSTVGISDDPKDKVDSDRKEKAYRLLQQCTSASGDITQISHGDDSYLVSWANVMLVTDGNGDLEFKNLIDAEVRLQHLWYKLHLYSDAIDGIVERLDTIDIKEVKREIVKTKLQFAQFCRVNPTGATHFNELHESLVLTSKLHELYQEFLFRTQMIDELESIL